MSDTTTTDVPTMSDNEREAVKTQFAAIAPVIELFRSTAREANELAERIIQARKSPDAAVDHVLSTSDDSKIIEWRALDSEYRAEIARLQAEVDDNRNKARQYAAQFVGDATFDMDEARKSFTELREKATAMRRTIGVFAGADSLDAIVEAYGISEIVSLKGSGGQKTAGATGVRRPRLASVTFDGAVVEDDKGKTSFTVLKSFLGKHVGAVDIDTVRKAVFAAAGTDDLSSLEGGTEISAEVVVDGKTHRVTVVTAHKPSKVSEVTDGPDTDDTDES